MEALSSMDVVAFLGVFLGVVFRTFYPYLRKVREAEIQGETLTFDYDYLYTAIGSLVVSLAITIMLFPTFQIPVDVPLIYVFSFGFAFGYTSNDLLNDNLK